MQTLMMTVTLALRPFIKLDSPAATLDVSSLPNHSSEIVLMARSFNMISYNVESL